MDDSERDELVSRIVERLYEEGVPEGTWLLEIAQVRASLRSADSLLGRLHDALVRAATDRNLDTLAVAAISGVCLGCRILRLVEVALL